MFKKLVVLAILSAVSTSVLGCGGGNAPDPAKKAEGDAVIEAARKAKMEKEGKQ